MIFGGFCKISINIYKSIVYKYHFAYINKDKDIHSIQRLYSLLYSEKNNQIVSTLTFLFFLDLSGFKNLTGLGKIKKPVGNCLPTGSVF